MFSFFFFFFWFQQHYLIKSNVNSARMHCLWVLQILLFSHFFIKNGSHSTIYTFKNYFATVFLVSVKISSIQTNPNFYLYLQYFQQNFFNFNKISRSQTDLKKQSLCVFQFVYKLLILKSIILNFLYSYSPLNRNFGFVPN